MPDPEAKPVAVQQIGKEWEEHQARLREERALRRSALSVRVARRVILTVFVPLVVVLSTYSVEHELGRFKGALVVERWHEMYWYWPVMTFFTAVYLWKLWGSPLTMQVSAEERSGA
ncbi:MAG: hypothetical protein KDB61_06550 [Planctomycetes bacterium]|nr:hypothetical protein [Planctomycetota bacterium]